MSAELAPTPLRPREAAAFDAETRRRRRARGWSQPDLAHAAGLARHTVQRAELGRAVDPGSAVRLADALDLAGEARRRYLEAAGTLPPESFGARLLAARTRLGLSQSATARRAGIAASVVARYESGERVAPLRATVAGLCRALTLPRAEEDGLWSAAGYLPPSLVALGPDDPTVRCLVAILADDAVDERAKASLRATVETCCAAPWAGGRG